jgi:hypothetical protein
MPAENHCIGFRDAPMSADEAGLRTGRVSLQFLRSPPDQICLSANPRIQACEPIFLAFPNPSNYGTSSFTAPPSSVPRKNPAPAFCFCNSAPLNAVVFFVSGWKNVPLNSPDAGVMVNVSLSGFGASGASLFNVVMLMLSSNSGQTPTHHDPVKVQAVRYF